MDTYIEHDALACFLRAIVTFATTRKLAPRDFDRGNRLSR